MHLIESIPVDKYDILTSNTLPVWKRVITCNERQSNEIVDPNDINQLTYNKRPIFNKSKVARQIVDTLVNHNGTDICQMCLSDVPTRNMTSACGNCSNRVCEQCVDTWFAQTKIGNIVFEGHCLCPFCKKVPRFHTIRHVDLCRILNLRPTKRNKNKTCDWDPKSVYAFCIKCNNLKVAMLKECTQFELPVITNFVCGDCHTLSIIDDAESIDKLNIKSCPNCQTSTEHNGGCNHISCPCGAHWCWVCNSASSDDGELFDNNSIYDHMADCGGIFPRHLRE
jgi:hypothetical protein